MPRKLKYLLRRTINGTAYVYFRGRGGKLTRINEAGPEGSPEFMAAYARCLQQHKGVVEQPRETTRVGVMPDSLAAAITIYLSSTKFESLRPSTRARILKQCEAIRTWRKDGTGPEFGTAPLRGIDVDAIDIYSEAVAKQAGASVADRHVHVLSSIWKAARKHPQFGIKKLSNPTVEAESHYRVQMEHRPWPIDIEEQFIATAPANLALAVLVLHFSMQRGGDCVKMRWDDYDGRGIYVRQEKTHGERDAVANYHVCPAPLREALDAAPRTADTILVNAYGRPYTASSTLSKAIARHLRRMGVAKKGVRSLVMHGLRKSGACDVIAAGASVPQLQAAGGWKSASQAIAYAKKLDPRKLQASSVELWDAELLKQKAAREVAKRRAQIKVIG